MADYAIRQAVAELWRSDHPFRTMDNVTVTPHLGYVTRETLEAFYSDTMEGGGCVRGRRADPDREPRRAGPSTTAKVCVDRIEASHGDGEQRYDVGGGTRRHDWTGTLCNDIHARGLASARLRSNQNVCQCAVAWSTRMDSRRQFRCFRSAVPGVYPWQELLNFASQLLAR
jgi:hypothetical protein